MTNQLAGNFGCVHSISWRLDDRRAKGDYPRAAGTSEGVERNIVITSWIGRRPTILH